MSLATTNQSKSNNHLQAEGTTSARGSRSPSVGLFISGCENDVTMSVLRSPKNCKSPRRSPSGSRSPYVDIDMLANKHVKNKHVQRLALRLRLEQLFEYDSTTNIMQTATLFDKIVVGYSLRKYNLLEALKFVCISKLSNEGAHHGTICSKKGLTNTMAQFLHGKKKKQVQVTRDDISAYTESKFAIMQTFAKTTINETYKEVHDNDDIAELFYSNNEQLESCFQVLSLYQLHCVRNNKFLNIHCMMFITDG